MKEIQILKNDHFIVVLFNLIEVAKLPEKHQQLLVELDLLSGVRQISLSQRIGQQTSETLQYKVKVLRMGDRNIHTLYFHLFSYKNNINPTSSL